MTTVDAMNALNHPVTTVEIAGKWLGLSRNAAYAAVKAGQIPSLRFGGKIVVPVAPLRKMLGLAADVGGQAIEPPVWADPSTWRLAVT